MSSERLPAVFLQPFGEGSRKQAADRRWEELAQEPFRGRRCEIDLRPAAEQDYATRVVFIGTVELGQRGAQLPTGPRRMPEAGEMRLQEVEDEPISLREVAALASTVEQERLRMPKGRGNRNIELVLNAHRSEPELVEACPA